MIFRPTTAWARSIRSLRNPRSDVDTKLDYLTRSEQAIERVLERTKPPNDHDESPKEAAERRFHRAEGSFAAGQQRQDAMD